MSQQITMTGIAILNYIKPLYSEIFLPCKPIFVLIWKEKNKKEERNLMGENIHQLSQALLSPPSVCYALYCHEVTSRSVKGWFNEN